MNYPIYTILFLLGTAISSFAQPSAENIIEPLLFDIEAISGVGLKKIDLKDEPEKDFYQKKLYWGKELGIFVVSTETWNNKIENYSFDEFVYMYQGEAMVKPKIGASQLFYSGDYFFAPKGFKGEWEIRAGNNLHYELSVIATTRADSTLEMGNPQHVLFDRSTLSGNAINFEENKTYEELLHKGVELTINMKAEQPSTYLLPSQEKETIIHILSGKISLEVSDQKTFTFHTGQYFLLPIGCQGKWTSNGHGLIKYLTIERTKN